VPVVSTRVGGIHEHLNDDLGKLTEPGNEQEFLEVLDDVLNNLGNYDARGIRKYAEDHFSEEVIGNSLYEVYKGVAQK
jgi:glycosyltransferase involved in cell wall biosynthesis